MKYLFVIILIPFISNLFAQKIEGRSAEYYVNTYLGEFNGYDMYYNKDLFVGKKDIKVIGLKDTSLFILGEIHNVNKESIINFFYFNNTFYLLSQSKSKGIISFNLHEYSDKFVFVKTELLIDLPVIKKVPILRTELTRSVVIKVKDGLLGMVIYDDKGISLVYNLQSKERSVSTFGKGGLSLFQCSDFVFNDKLQMNIIFEYSDFKKTGKHENCAAVLVTCSDSKSNDQYLILTKEASLRSFKFGSSPSNDLLLGSLVFSGGADANIIGYSYLPCTYGFDNPIAPQIIINHDLDKPELWSEKEYELRTSKRKSFYNSDSQKLQEIIFKSKDSVLFISQCQLYIGGGSVSMGGSYSPGSPTAGAGGFTYGSNETFSGANIFYDFIVSSINTKKRDVNWTNKSIGLNKPGVVLTNYKNNELNIYVPVRTKLSNEESSENKGVRYPLTIYSVSLLNGTSKFIQVDGLKNKDVSLKKELMKTDHSGVRSFLILGIKPNGLNYIKSIDKLTLGAE